MISHGGPSEIQYLRKARELGISEEVFNSLPYELQHAIIMHGQEENPDEKRMVELEKRIALKQYLFGEKVKVKIKSLFKKNK